MDRHFTGQPNDIKRGDVYYINNNRGQRGNEIKKDRPAVVVSADFLNRYSDNVVVVFLTSQPKKDMSTHVTVRATGRVSEALCEQTTTVSVERLNNRIGSVTDKELQEIDTALQIALNLDIGAGTPPVPDIQTEQTETGCCKEMLDTQHDCIIRLEAERDIYKKLYENMLKAGGRKENAEYMD